MSEYQEIQIAIKVIERHFTKAKVRTDIHVNNMQSSDNWDAPVDQMEIVETLKGLSVLIAFEDVIKELKTLASDLEKANKN